ncbi:MAG: hypothetical protein LBM02_10210 [Lachnospiraceae bacterium]|jgi:hypothetical protein|nr:hypothetical protein [Lachnospiraceae bacterium]
MEHFNIKKGSELVHGVFITTDKLYVDLKYKWTYIDSNLNHKTNTLYISTKNGDIEIRCKGIFPNLEFEYEEDDQLVFKIV